jgi:EcsC protein family
MRKPPVIPPALPGQGLSAAELEELAYAKSLLENPGLTARISNVLGAPIEKGFKMLPKGWSDTVNKVSRTALLKALQMAVATMRGPHARRKSSERFHKLLVGASGGIGGAFGLSALAIELPISTTIMLRSIADIARSEGHDVSSMRTRIDCLEVFALGGRSGADDSAESGYWAVRAALARAVSEAASYLAEKGVLEKSAPAIVRLVGSIASRFGVVVSEQVAAKAVPVIGAAGGSIVNVLFMGHFQEMARGHFIVRRLEQRYGTLVVKEAYERLAVPIR